MRGALTSGLIALALLAGVERAVIGAPADQAGVASLVGPICHAASGAGTPDDPASPTSHNCCDECALTAAALVPPAPLLSEPTRLAARVTHGAFIAGVATARPWSPRQPQGPPTA